jgi:flagellum-specific peptidoglycan hydrolase FlgJ
MRGELMVKTILIGGMIGLGVVANQYSVNHCLKVGDKPQNNIQCVIDQSRASMPNHLILADLMAAQAIHESGLHEKPSKLARYGSNLFGIKGKGDCGSIKLKTFEWYSGKKKAILAEFARYCSLYSSFVARKNMYDKPRYSILYNAKSFEEAAYLIQKAGYATDPIYAKYLIAVYYKYIKGK